MWNDWLEDEHLLQLAGHLCDKASQEWSLLSVEEKSSFTIEVGVLHACLDPGRQALAAQDFAHTIQSETESVATYITILERVFHIAYGHEKLTAETRDVFCIASFRPD